MKRILCILALLALASATKEDDEDKLVRECLLEFGQDPDSMREIMHAATEGDVEALQIVGCIQHCMFQKLGVIQNGEINMSKVSEDMEEALRDVGISKNQIMQKLKKCADEMKAVSNNECVASLIFTQCLTDWKIETV